LVGFAGQLHAQRPVASLGGVVTDPQGAVYPGANAKLTNQATGATHDQVSGGDGHYLFADLPPGDYTLRVEAHALAATEFKNLKLEVGRSETLNVSLKLAQAGETINVNEAWAGVELTQSEVQNQIESETVQEIPLNGRNFLELAFLLPGNHTSVNFDPTKTNSLEVSSAGSFGRGGNISVDGGDNNDEVVGGTLANFPQDSIREFQIATNRYTAEVGRSASSVINIVTKSGTNEFHGSGFLFERNRKLGALAATYDRSLCVPGQDCRPPFDRQQYGGSIGGPIVKNKAWLFASVENRHQNASVPTATRDFADETIVQGATGAPLRDKLASTRLDVTLSPADTVYGRYSYNQSVDTSNGSLHGGVGSGSPANLQQSLNRFNSLVANWTHTFGNTKVNSFVFHYDAFLNNIPAYGADFPTFDVSQPGLGLNPQGKPSEIVFPDLQDGQTYRAPQRTPFDRKQLRDAFDWTKGRHNMHFGGEFQNYGAAIVFDLYGSSSIFMAQDFATQDLNGDGAVNDLDIPVASALLSTAAKRPPTSPQERNTYLATYFQDDWRVIPNLTLNLGIRYEHDTSLFGTSSLHDNLYAVKALNLHRSSDPKDVSPRVGFAWDPLKNGRTVIRGGVGIYYDRVVLETPLLELLLNGDTLALSALGGSICDKINPQTLQPDCSIPGAHFLPGTPTLANPYVGAPAKIGVGVDAIANNTRHPMVQQYTMGIQQQVGSTWLVSADGIHNFGTGFLMGRELRDQNNAPVSIVDPATGVANSVTTIGSYAKTWYDGLLIAVKKQSTKLGPVNYNFTVNYTLSKAFNYSNDDQIPFNTGAQADVVMGGYDPRLEKGYASTDERHHLAFFGSLGLPWQFSLAPIWTLSSPVPGDPFSPALGARIPILSRGALGREIRTGTQLNEVIARFNALPACPSTPTNAGPFPCNPGAVQLDTVNPNAHFGSWFDSFDLRLTKVFKIKEHNQFDLVAEGFNLCNITNYRGFNTNNYFGFNTTVNNVKPFTPPATYVNQNPTFGKPTNTAGGFFGSGGPRAFQFALRYSF
jgi:hypothetical protein